ncbi:hypothetical protein C2S51_019767 [Perilla frutescens var. frutescens]|nr:hypothetical protein C2S51_019767 [Perilla frutescens var. frutescens]
MQDVSCSINLYWKNYASSIVDILRTVTHTDVDMAREFRDGPFGLLMNFVGGTSCNTALHAVMAQEITLDGAVEHKVWFHIGGTNLRFSPVEYALVTGLMFGGSDFDPYVEHRIPRDSFYSRLLSCVPISIHDLHHRFTHYMLGDDASDYLKVANVLFLYGMVLGYDPPRCIDDWVWVLVEDTQRWKFFPWGSYSFGALLHYISLIPVELTAKRKTYHFYGPVWALQSFVSSRAQENLSLPLLRSDARASSGESVEPPVSSIPNTSLLFSVSAEISITLPPEMAFAAVDSLLHTIEGLLDSRRTSVDSSTGESLQSARDHARSLRSKLKCCGEGVTEMDELLIIEEARKLEDAIEIPLSTLFLSPAFNQLREDVDCFAKTAKEMEGNIQELWEQKAAKMIEEYYLMIRNELNPKPKNYEMNAEEMVVWMSGMAGIGKTMLAKKIYHDPSVKANFECRAFVRVGQYFWVKEVLQAIAAQLNLDFEIIFMELDEDLSKCFFRIVTVRKSLIVLDDVWGNAFVDLLTGIGSSGKDFGSRILVTSRINFKSHSVCDCYDFEMRLMNEEESWELLRRNVFGDLESSCPPQLLKAGKKIAEKCEGLPLLIIAVAPVLLSKAQKNVEDWNRVAEKPKLVMEEACDQISEKNFWGLNKACSFHCAYWYVSKKVGKNNKFLYTIDSYKDGLDKCVESHRRLAIHTNVMFAIKEVHNKIASVPTIRSLLCTGPYHQYQVPICWEWRLLKVLDALSIRYYKFPIEVVKLVQLRYLALTCNADLPPSISKLCSLEFLIVHQHVSIKQVVAVFESYVPVTIWDLQELQHLEIIGRNLPDPPHPGAVLPNLTKLLGVGAGSCTKAVLWSIPKLEKLRIQIELAPNAAEILSGCDHISCLHELESLQSVVMNPTLSRPPPPLSVSSSSLRKLSLSGFGYPWEDMSKIAHLPNLEVLKLKSFAFRGEKWEVEEMEFCKLWYLLIEDTDLVQWTGTHCFRRLLRLRMKNCYKLQQISSSLVLSCADIELIDCNPLAEKQFCDDGFREVTANYSWKEEKGVKTL